MRYIDATYSRLNRQHEGPAAPVALRAVRSMSFVTQGQQDPEATTRDTEVLLTA